MKLSIVPEKHRIRLKYTAAALTLEALGILALFAVLGCAVLRYPALGETVARSFAPDGTPTEWAVREYALVFPIFAVFVYVIVSAAGLVVRRAAPPDRPCPTLSVILNGVAAAKVVFLLYAFVRTRCAMSGVPAPGWLLPLMLVAFALVAAAAVFSARNVKRR